MSGKPTIERLEQKTSGLFPGRGKLRSVAKGRTPGEGTGYAMRRLRSKV